MHPTVSRSDHHGRAPALWIVSSDFLNPRVLLSVDMVKRENLYSYRLSDTGTCGLRACPASKSNTTTNKQTNKHQAQDELLIKNNDR